MKFEAGNDEKIRTIVRTREELVSAKSQNYDEIIVLGDIANKVKKAKKVTTLGKAALAALAAALGVSTVTVPVTGGISYLAAVPVAAMTGLQVAHPL